MTVGPNVSEYDRSNSQSVISRLMAAELSEPINGELETILGVMREAQPRGEAGDSFIYCSVVTQTLMVLAEAVSK